MSLLTANPPILPRSPDLLDLFKPRQLSAEEVAAIEDWLARQDEETQERARRGEPIVIPESR